MINQNKCLKLFEIGFSLITVGESKIPNFSWKSAMTKPLDEKEFIKRYNYNGGKSYYSKKQGKEVELPATKNVGLVTGYGWLEVVDVDLKVFSTAKEQKEFWEEFLGFLEDNILDFHDKFVIAKTKNNGFHILFKWKRVSGNKKIAKRKGHKEARIETRGNGGYVFVYEDFLNGKSYKDVDFISDEDREILFSCARTYDYIEPRKKVIPRTENKKYVRKNGDISPWDDFNQKNNVWDIVGDEFTIVSNLKDRYVIKRHNATSPHSGYIYKDNDVMYLFSTGTIYEAEKTYDAWGAHVRKNFQGDFSEAAKKAYRDGYGSRIVKVDEPIFDKPDIDKDKLKFPIDIFPEQIQAFILEANETLNVSIEYMECSLLWAISVSIGNSINVEVIPGWHE